MDGILHNRLCPILGRIGPEMSKSSVGLLVCAAFEELSARDVTYCVVGRTDTLPDHLRSDVDVVLMPRDFARLRSLMSSVSERVNGRIVQCLRHEVVAHYYVIAIRTNDGQYLYLSLDSCSNYMRGGRLLLTAQEILVGRRKAVGSLGEEKCFFVASPPMEFIYYLLKKVDKKSLSNDQEKHLSSVFRQAPVQAQEQVGRFFGSEATTRIVHAAASGEWVWVQQNIAVLQADLWRKAAIPRRNGLLREAARWISRIVYPTGIHVVILGPDGSGKSSVAKLLAASVSPLFRRAMVCHLFPPFLRATPQSSPIERPHEVRPRGWATSILKLLYWYYRYAVGWLTWVYPAEVRSTLVLFDRYYHDLLVDPKRYRYGAPIWMARLLGRLIPKPDLWVVLDAPPEVLQQRKQEVPFGETARQGDAYRRLAGQLRDVVLVDAAQSLNKVVADVTDAIVECMAERMRKRLKQ